MKLNTSRALQVRSNGKRAVVSVPPEYGGFKDYVAKQGYKVTDLSEETYRKITVEQDGKKQEEMWSAQDFTTDASAKKIGELFCAWPGAQL